MERNFYEREKLKEKLIEINNLNDADEDEK